jgi:hypothetical protein
MRTVTRSALGLEWLDGAFAAYTLAATRYFAEE